MQGAGSSQHPADQLMRQLILTSRTATDEEIRSLIDRIANAPFNTRYVPVDVGIVGRTDFGLPLPARAAAGMAHLWKRVLIDRQWSFGTTYEQYLSDTREAVRHQSARIVLVTIRGGPSAGVLGPNLTPPTRLGVNFGPFIFVGYSVNGGMISTAYQLADVSRLKLPGNARWLN